MMCNPKTPSLTQTNPFFFFDQLVNALKALKGCKALSVSLFKLVFVLKTLVLSLNKHHQIRVVVVFFLFFQWILEKNKQ
ncbi:hypothetical protein QVD17_38783 [Tagetes erecta]|uniref:Uncharacterized protein n=1 Tax=Tagetes erecta TaxID=13708 RepID=A0AAD8JSR5_TARER|nr:hypothetical protein QVD17_38783 [Tagetes erecta]